MNTRIVVLIVSLILLTMFATVFAMINYTNTVKVWPLMSYQPLTLVIGVAFALGAGAGALLISLLHHARMHLPPTTPPEGIPIESAGV